MTKGEEKDPKKNSNPKGGDPSGEPTPPKNPGTSDGEINLADLSEEQLAKVLEDPRIWKTKRLEELRKDSKELAKLKEDAETARKKQLEEEGKTKELLEETQKELEQLKSERKENNLNNLIMKEALSKGIKDVDVASKIIDRSLIKEDENGDYTGVSEAVAKLAEDKPYLIDSSPKKGIGNPSNPGSQGGDATFKLSQIRDPEFYQEHRDDILKAQREGNIEDDVTPSQ